MSEGSMGLTIWKSIMIKVLLVLIIPIAIGFYPDMIAYASLLFTVSLFHEFVLNDPYQILTVLVLITPGILFYRYMLKSPISSPIRRNAVLTAVVLWAGPVVYSTFYEYFMMGPTIFLPIVSISMFILLPILQRELVIRSSPMKIRNFDFAYLSRSFKHRFGKQRFLPILLWSGLLFSPFLLLSQYFDQLIFISVFYQINWMSYYGGIIAESFFGSLNFLVTYGSALPYILLMSSLRFLFVRDIFKFKDGIISKTRLVSVAFLAEVTPTAILSILYFPIDPYYYSFSLLVLPFPLFPLIGFLFLRLCKIIPIRETLWDDEEHRMWFDGDRPTLSPIQPPMEQGIKVPITYMIVSQFRKLRKQ